MLDHMILTVSNVERSLAFYEAALKPLNIKFFLPYKGEGDHPDLWGFGDGKRAKQDFSSSKSSQEIVLCYIGSFDSEAVFL
jgi:catechol 2,3-dioxygenase-like lactoylglutathione lyase family enzyme